MKRNMPRNILIIKPGAIGDVLHLTPTIRAIKSANPQAEVSLIVGSQATAELFKYNPHVSRTFVFDKGGKHRTIRAMIELWRHLRRNKYDLVINFQRSNIKTWFLASAAFPSSVLVYHKTKNRIVHAIDDYLKTVLPLGITTCERRLDLEVGEEAIRFSDLLFEAEGLAGRKTVAFNPGASHPVNRWGANRFAELADMLAERIGAKVIIVGGPDDVPLAHDILARTKTGPLILAGKTNLLQLGAVLKRCGVLVTGDTGPMHIAAAVGAKVVALFGAADPERTGPIGCHNVVLQSKKVPCVPCRSRRCKNSFYLECMERITPQEVFEAILSISNRG